MAAWPCSIETSSERLWERRRALMVGNAEAVAQDGGGPNEAGVSGLCHGRASTGGSTA